MKFKYSIYRPSGNDTALVCGLIQDRSLRKIINDSIQKKHSNVEQVGFVEKIGNEFYLEMAGGEFCGNATRSTIHYFLGGNPGKIKIHSSGVSRELNGGINQDGKVWVEMPINHDLNKIFVKNNYTVVEMEGISHVIINKNLFENDLVMLKTKALEILKLLNLDKEVPAAGVIFTSEISGGIKIDPVVWVRNLETLYYETACGSGTTAVGLFQSKMKNKSLSINITQPSNMDITVSVDKNNSEFVRAAITGTVKLLQKDLEIYV